jgi:dihydroflavonol-4-reductase
MPHTVVLTGASGFIAKHVLLKLLAAGHRVRASIRSPSREAAVRAAVLPHLPAAAADRLAFVRLDLLRDEGWADAMAGASALVHTASPFPIAQPKNADDLIRPAVDGTLRALRAAQAADVARVVLTSSVAAIVHPGGKALQDESDWADAGDPGTTAYTRSKTLAERAAWDFVASSAPAMALTTINPGFVLGPPLDGEFGSSIAFVRRVLSGKDPMLPDYGLPIVDVRDVAEMHLRALHDPSTAGKRYIASAGSLSFPELGRTLKAAYPERRIATKAAPKLVLRLLSLFDAEVRSILPKIGTIERVSNARAVQEMGMAFVSPQDALRASAAFLVERKLA